MDTLNGSERPEFLHSSYHFVDNFDEPFTLACGYKVETAPFLFYAELLQETQENSMALDGLIVALLIVAVSKMACQDEHTIRSALKRLKDELGINPPAAQYPYGMDIGRICDLCNPCLIGPCIGTPGAEEPDDPRFETLRVSRY